VAGLHAGSPGPTCLIVPVVPAFGEQTWITFVSSGCRSFHSDHASTKAEGRRPMLLRLALVGNSSSSLPM